MIENVSSNENVSESALWEVFDKYVGDKDELEWFHTLNIVEAVKFALISREKKAWAARVAIGRVEKQKAELETLPG